MCAVGGLLVELFVLSGLERALRDDALIHQLGEGNRLVADDRMAVLERQVPRRAVHPLADLLADRLARDIDCRSGAARSG